MADKNNLPSVGFNWNKIASNMQEQNASAMDYSKSANNPAPVIPVDSLKTDKRTTDAITQSNKNATAPTPTGMTRLNEGTVSEAISSQKTQPDMDSVLKQTLTKIAGRNVADERADVRTELDLARKQKASTDLANQLTAKQESLRKRVQELQTTAGLTKAQADAKVAEETRVANREIADISFSYKVANDDYQGAEKIANERIADMTQQYQNDVNTFQMVFNMMQNDMTESEKVQAQQAFEMKKMERQAEIDRQAVKYKFDLENALGGGGKAPEIQKINGKDYQWDSTTGKWTIADISDITPDKIANETEFNDVLEKYNQLTSVINDEGTLNNMTGVLRGSISTWLGAGDTWGGKKLKGVDAINKKNDALNTISYFIDNYTLDNLKQAKAEGVSFGALSEKELSMIASAATRLGAAADRDEKTNRLKGFTGSKEQIKKDLELIQSKLKKQQDSLNRSLLPESDQLEIINIK